MNTESKAARLALRCPAPGGLFPVALRLPGHTLALAADLPALEACLALERAHASQPASEGIQSPQAVPYCDFLMLHSNQGGLVAVVRLMRLDEANPIPNPLATSRFHLSPLLTALRYSREGILEMGAPVFAAGCDHAKAARMLWTGLGQYLERNGLGFVIGRDSVKAPQEQPSDLPRIMASHGLPPDLETETRSGFRLSDAEVLDHGISGLAGEAKLRFWPAGLQEALLRGCRLACEPAWNPGASTLEFVWVVSREMLVDSGGDWRGAGA